MSYDISAVRQWSSWLLQFSVLILVIWMPLRDVLHTGRFRRPFLSMWGGLIGWSVLVCYLSPLLVLLCSADVHTFEYFPDIKVMARYAGLGWIPALVFCGLGVVVRAGWNALSGGVRNHHRLRAWSL